jgi:SAM-dependent methyltransferase
MRKDNHMKRFFDDNDTEYYSEHIHVINKKHMMKYLKFACRKPIKLLDVGCGLGYYVKDALDEGFDAHGIEISKPALLKALPGVSGKLQYGSITEIPFDNEQFDAVICFDVIEHIKPSDTEQAIHELYRVLKPGGFLILTTPSMHFGEWVYNMSHINCRPEKFWDLMFSKFGFKVKMPYVPSFLKYYFNISLPDSVAFKLEEPLRYLVGSYYVRKGRLYMLARRMPAA